MEKKVHKLIRYSKDGINVVGDINASIASGETGQHSVSSVRSRNRITQRNGKTVSESTFDSADEKEVNP
jgi:hypothetical protein